jgi:transcriptional regulator with XRE-family HTH domain
MWIRAARRARRVSQRELAELADIPPATLARAEADKTMPRLDTFVTLLGALGYQLVLVDQHGRPLVVDAAHEKLRNAGGRRFPAHLEYGRTPSADDGGWWGWWNIAWPGDPRSAPPEHTFWQRPPAPRRVGEDSLRATVWDDAT